MFQQVRQFCDRLVEDSRILHEQRDRLGAIDMRRILTVQLLVLLIETYTKNILNQDNRQDNTDHTQRISDSISQSNRIVRHSVHIGKCLLGSTQSRCIRYRPRQDTDHRRHRDTSHIVQNDSRQDS